MNLEDLLNDVPNEWRKDFQNFVESGEASPAFEDALNTDQNLQGSVERAFAAKSEGLEDFAKAVAEARTQGDAGRGLKAISSGLAESLHAAVKLAPADCEQVMTLAAARVAKIEPERVDRMRELLGDLQTILSERGPAAGPQKRGPVRGQP
jgi:hypothetical protein